MSSLRNSLAVCWHWSWIFTLPMVVMFVHWGLRTGQQFAQFGLRIDIAPFEFTLRETGKLEFAHMLRSLGLQFSGTVPRDDDGCTLRTVELFLGDEEIETLDADLPYSGEHNQGGRLRFQGTDYDVSLRYRGDTVLHWGYFKKSFRVTTKKGQLVEGMRKFNLVVGKTDEQLNNHLSYRLANRLGLITPTCELVRVFVNGTYHGLYELTEQLEEGTLRRHDRMPGDLYSGEMIMLDNIEGTTNRVFEYPRVWSKVAANNHYELASRAPLERLHAILQGNPDESSLAALAQLVDLDRFARFSALEVLTQTQHNDHRHNWRLFWDPWRLRFEPVVWDIVGWHESMRPEGNQGVDLEIISSQLHEWLHMHAEFLRARYRHLHHFFAGGHDDAFLAEAERELEQALLALRADPNAMPQNANRIVAAMADFTAFIHRAFRAVEANYVNGTETLRWCPAAAGGAIDLEVATRRPMNAVEIDFDGPQMPTSVKLVLLRDGAEQTTDLTSHSSLSTGALRVPVALISELAREFEYRGRANSLRNSRRRVVATSLRLVLDGVDVGRIREVWALRDEGRDPFQRTATLSRRPVGTLFQLATPPNTTFRSLAGEIAIKGVTEVVDPVRIAAGTTFRLDPGASLLFRNRVIAEGTKEAPIRFEPTEGGQAPWGTIAINGPQCADSVFRWCTVRGGSGYKVPLEEYCSMFSVHNCTGIRIEDCAFSENREYDDMIHVMYSEVVFDRVTLTAARADALDCDISTVIIKNSSFPRSGNDGVDLMTTRALVLDCTFEGNGDKGISIGEGSRLIGLRNRFRGCSKGMEAKDGSIAWLANCDIRGCKKALNAYKKNWRYDSGGYITVTKSFVGENGSLPTADVWSRAQLLDCQVKGELVADYDQEYVDGSSTRMRNTARLVDCDGGPGPKMRLPLPFPLELGMLEPLASSEWGTVRSDVRGGVQ
jgi:spore coat protein CotH